MVPFIGASPQWNFNFDFESPAVKSVQRLSIYQCARHIAHQINKSEEIYIIMSHSWFSVRETKLNKHRSGGKMRRRATSPSDSSVIKPPAEREGEWHPAVEKRIGNENILLEVS